MKSNEIVQKEIFEIIKNQINSNNPPETRETFDRLKGLGYSDLEVKKFIGQCLSLELFEILKHKRPFNAERYVANLKKLPAEPF